MMYYANNHECLQAYP